MKACIYGAGAIGGYLGASLAEAGVDVSLIARGPHGAAIKDNGLKLRIGGEEKTYAVTCTENPEDLGPQDYVLITLKAHSVPHIVKRLPVLFNDRTAVVSCVNGVPWWYFFSLKGDYENLRLETVDPGGQQWDVIGPKRMIGAVVYPACEVPEPGVIEHIDGNKFSLGEPSGEKTDRVAAIAKLMQEGGLRAPVKTKIRDEIWVKLWGNLSFNPVSALTGATLEEICTDGQTRAVIKSMMLEAQEIGEKLGVRFPVDVERRIEGGKAVGAHKTSMLQDLERGRPMEIDALVSAVQELGRLVAVPTPTIDTVLALVSMRAREAGLYG
jgi:2-dehydropantoate 2-reductase